MRVTCESCKAQYNLPDEKVRGRRARVHCRKCQASIVVDGMHLAPKPSLPFDDDYDDDDATQVLNAPRIRALAQQVQAPQPPAIWTVNLSETDERELSENELVQGWLDGLVTDDAYVWREGLDDWTAIADVPELVEKINAAMDGAEPPAATEPEAEAEPEGFLAGPSDRVFAKMPSIEETKPLDLGHGSRLRPAAQRPVYAASRARRGPPARESGGERRENSVAFSLDSLKSAAGESGPSAPPDRVSDEVLVAPQSPPPDFAPLPPVSLQSSPKATTAAAEARPPSSTRSFVPRPATPFPTASKPPVQAPAAAAHVPFVTTGEEIDSPAAKKRGAMKFALAALVLGVGVGGFVVVRKTGILSDFQSTPEPNAAPLIAAVPLPSAKPESAALVEPTPNPGNAPEEPQDEPKDTLAGTSERPAPSPQSDTPQKSARGEGGSNSNQEIPDRVEKPAVAREPEPKAANDEPEGTDEPAKDKPKATDELAKDKPEIADEAPKGESETAGESSKGKPETTDESAEGEVAAGPFNAEAAKAVLKSASDQAQSCKTPDGPTGVGQVQVTFVNSGRVTGAVLSGDGFGGTSVGGCVVRTFRRSRVPQFGGPPVTVSKSFRIE